MPVSRRRLQLFALFATLVFVALTTGLVAQAQGLPMGDNAAPDMSIPNQMLSWIFAQQRRFQREINVIFHRIAVDGGVRASAWLIAVSFLYGVLHAAGPGHGKAILSTYLLSHRETALRAATLASAAALWQGVTAILLVYGLVWVVGWPIRETSSAVAWSGRIAASLVMMVGFFLAFRTARILLRQARPRPNHDHARNHHHEQHHDHDDACGCGHRHVPNAAQMAETGNWRATLGLIFSIGLRPCSGAILILAFAHVMHLAWTGIVAVLVMSAGTALSVTCLALLAIKARDWSVSIGGGESRRFTLLGGLVSLTGGLLIIWLGALLVAASFSQGHPLGLT